MVEHEYIIDLNTVTLLDMNDPKFMNHKQKELLKLWNALPEDYIAQIRNQVKRYHKDVLLSLTAAEVKVIRKDEVQNLLQTGNFSYKIINDIQLSTQFKNNDTGELYVYQGLYF